MTGFALVVRFMITPGHEAAFDDLVDRTLVGIRSAEPNTLSYASHAVQGAPGERIFYELYRDRAAFEAHEAQPHVQEFLAARGEHLDSYTVDVLDLIAAKAPEH
jgi:quinol monooxygenase YgiN